MIYGTRTEIYKYKTILIERDTFFSESEIKTHYQRNHNYKRTMNWTL